MILNSINNCAAYLRRHENHFGFLPQCIGTDRLSWEKLYNELKSVGKVLPDKLTGKPILRIYGIPIINCENLE